MKIVFGYPVTICTQWGAILTYNIYTGLEINRAHKTKSPPGVTWKPVQPHVFGPWMVSKSWLCCL